MADGPSIKLAYDFLRKAERTFNGVSSRITVRYVQPGESIRGGGHTLQKWPDPDFAVRVNPCILSPDSPGCDLYCDSGPFAVVQNFKIVSEAGATVRIFDIVEEIRSNYSFPYDGIRGERNESSADRVRKALRTLCVRYRQDLLSLKEERESLYVEPCYVDRNYYEQEPPS